jgi:Molecular chaperone (small heat shock protein)
MLKYQITIGALCFVLGIAVLLLIQNYKNPKDRDVGVTSEHFSQERGVDRTLDSFFNDDFFKSSKSPFDEMRRMQERMMKQFKSSEDDPPGGIFDSWIKNKFGGGDPGDVHMREDENFVYYDVVIENLSDQKLEILVEDGRIKISGTIEEKSEDKGENENSRQFSISTFQRSFPVPYGVDSTRAEMEHEGDKVIIKLPKTK